VVVVILSDSLPSRPVPTSSARAFDSTGQAPGERPPANEPITPNSKKAPHPTGMVELLCDQIETTLGHCDLFQRLNTVFAPFERNAHYSSFISQRSGWIMFQISATCTFGAMGAKLWQNPRKNAIQKKQFLREMRSDGTPVTSKFCYRVQILRIVIASQETCEVLRTHSSSWHFWPRWPVHRILLSLTKRAESRMTLPFSCTIALI
jgi:hypothetical protein